MGTRGRRSTADLMIPKGMANRPDPPRELDAAEAIEWREIVASMQMGHFARVHYPMLVQLCRHVVEARHLQRMTTACRHNKNKRNNREYMALLRMQSMVSASIMKLQRSMRLTHISVMERTAIKKLRPVQNGNGSAAHWQGA